MTYNTPPAPENGRPREHHEKPTDHRQMLDTIWRPHEVKNILETPLWSMNGKHSVIRYKMNQDFFKGRKL